MLQFCLSGRARAIRPILPLDDARLTPLPPEASEVALACLEEYSRSDKGRGSLRLMRCDAGGETLSVARLDEDEAELKRGG